MIKAIRSLNMKVFLEVTRTLPNRFYTTVLKAFLHLLREVRGHCLDGQEEALDDHDSVVEFIKDRHYKLLQEASNLPQKLEALTREKTALIYDQRQEYFHKFKCEKDLYKYCLKSKEIKALLQVIFAVYPYCEEASQGPKFHKNPKTNRSPTKPIQKLH